MRLSRFRARGITLACLAATGLAACGNGTGTGNNNNLAKDQVFKFPINQDIGDFDPAKISAEVDSEFAQNVFEGLLKFNDKIEVVPNIATDLPTISSDGKTYTFKLKDGVKFSNGDPVTAKDFVYSWDRAAVLQGDYAGNFSGVVGYDAVSKGKAKHMDGLTATDDKTLTVKLTDPAGYFTTEVAFITASVVDQKVVDKDPEGWFTKPETYIGTGPFKLSAHVPKTSLEYVANANYWGSPKPTLTKVSVDVLGDLHSGITKFDTGGYDSVGYGGMSTLPPDDVLAIKNDPTKSKNLTIVPKVRTTWVGFNFQSGPFAGDAGKLGRQAFSMAIDRKQMADVACSKGVTCQPATGGIITKGLKGYLGDDADPNAVFDATKAKTLYKQWDPTGSKVKGLKYSFNSSEANQAVAENLQSQWQQNLGVKVDLESLERKSFFDRRDKKHEFSLFRGSWQADYDHPQDWFDNLFITALIGHGNAAAYSNKTFDQKVADADTKKVEDALPGYKDAGKILVDDVAYADLFYSQGAFLIKPYVSGAGSNNFFDYYWNEIKINQH